MNRRIIKGLFGLVIINLFCSNSSIWSYQWPVSPFTGPHPITGTLGEWRSTHLHAGVDIGRGTGTNVYPSITGTIPNPSPDTADDYENRHYFRVGNFKYVHINPEQTILRWLRLNPGQDYQATAGTTLLGTVDGANHLHLEEDDGGSNPLRDGGLDNYVDTSRTYVSTLEFFRQGTETQLTGPIYGKIDILSCSWDAQSNGSDKVSVYKIGYRVRNNEGADVIGPIENIIFDDLTGASRGFVYANFEGRQSTRNDYYYWVTNTPWEDDYWMTNQRVAGQRHEVAAVNSEAECPGGKYGVWVQAYDIKGNGGNLGTSEGAKKKEIVLDNFKPYVKEVNVSGRRIQYNGRWKLKSDGTLALKKEGGSLRPGKIDVRIVFSESMDTTIIPQVCYDPQGEDKGAGPQIINFVRWETTNYKDDTFVGKGVIPNVKGQFEGKAILVVKNAKDLAGNDIDGEPETIASYTINSDGTRRWNNHLPSIDQQHSFLIVFGEKTLALSVRGYPLSSQRRNFQLCQYPVEARVFKFCIFSGGSEKGHSVPMGKY